MKPEQIEELKRIAARIKDQDGRCTRDPFFIVFEKEDIPTDEEYAERHIWIDRESGECDEATEKETQVFDAWEEEGNAEDIPNRFEKVFIVERNKFVQAFFTEDGAKRYIERNGRNLKKPFIYADSFYRNAEMLTIWESLGDLLDINEDLLEALKALVRIQPCPEDGSQKEALAAAQRAIEKAEKGA